MKSIRRDLALRIVTASLGILLIGGFGLYFSIEEALERQFDRTLTTKAHALITASEIDDGEFEIDLDVQAFAGFGSLAPGDYFEIFTEDGASFMRSPSLGARHLTKPTGFGDRDREFADITLPDGVHGRAYWRAFVPSIDDDEIDPLPPPSLRMLVASDDGNLHRILRVIAIFILIVGGAIILASLLILNAVVHRGLKPLDRLSADVQRIGVDQLDHRLSVAELPLELRGVAAKLNELLGRLESAFVRERRFTADAAHELRTPIAELRALIELVVRWPDESTPERGQEMLLVISELESLLETLSVLAKAESGTMKVLESVDLESTLTETLDRFSDEIRDRGIRVERDLTPGSFHTDPILWRAILQNLVGNAVHYAPRGTVVRVSASSEGLRIVNEAPDLVDADLPHLFERFWRKTESRSGKGHSGLGLSLVRAAVDYLGGRCEAKLDAGTLTMEVKWCGSTAAHPTISDTSSSQI